MGAITIIRERAIHQPARQVWRVLGDYRRDPDWRTGVTTMTIDRDPPVVGARTVEHLELGGRRYRNVAELTDVTDLAISWRTVEGARASGARSVRPLDSGGCLARLELVVTPAGAERLLAPVLARMLRRNMAADLVRLAELAERASSEDRASR